MDNKDVVRLYENMNKININLNALTEDILLLKDSLNSNITYDEDCIEKDNIDNTKEITKDVKSSVKEVMNELKNLM